ncbi:MAG: poly-gamma-glutamate synthase PgsB [bacterium]|nr:poly-gamma-glutamate synthase PgsB [bacterium]
MLAVFFLLISLLIWWVIEFARHQRRIYSIPIRIHVNGTRGKSSVTRLISAGLRAGGKKTLAKTTGTLPRIIDEHGLEIAINRRANANILEQLKIIKFISRRKPDALVIECMAVQPEYQWICEHRIVHATHGVCTNARPDHLNEMGPTTENVGKSLSNTVPVKSRFFTAEHKLAHIFQDVAKRRETEITITDSSGITPEDMRGFSYVEHPENVALALAVTNSLGISRSVALKGMHNCFPDSGALKIFRVEHGGKWCRFVNAMAANDPESTLMIWNKAVERYQGKMGTRIVLLNTRADRFDRSLQLLAMTAKGIELDYFFSIGERTDRLLVFFAKYGIPVEKVVTLGITKPETIYEAIFEKVGTDGGTVIGIGNVGAGGLAVANLFRDRRVGID